MCEKEPVIQRDQTGVQYSNKGRTNGINAFIRMFLSLNCCKASEDKSSRDMCFTNNR